MAPASALCDALRSTLTEWTSRLAGAPAFRNTCLAGLAAVSAVVAAEPFEGRPAPAAASEVRVVQSPQYLPTYTPPAAQAPAAAPSPPVADPATPKSAPTATPNTVLLPPIQSLPEESKAAPPSRPAPKPAVGTGVHSPSLLDPPPGVGAPAQKPATESTLEVVVGQARVIAFPDVPQRVALAVDEKNPIATLKEVPQKAREWYIFGKKPGTAFLDVWLPDGNEAASYRVQHYLIHVVPPPDANGPLDNVYGELEREINRTFPGSSVRLKRVGDKLVVSGTARNIFEATRILTIARENAPTTSPDAAKNGPVLETPQSAQPSLQATLDNYARAGGPRVVNLLRIPGEQQIMLRVVVAEVNRSAAHSLGLDFGLGDRQATVLGQRSGTAGGTPTLAEGGWIGQALRTLQDRGYAQALAEPALTTLNGQTARFQVGGEFPVPVVTSSAGGAVQGVAFRSYGVKLAMQPVVADTNRIRLTVDTDVSATDPTTTAQVAGTAVPGLKVRNFQTTVELREGETLAVAGLIRGRTATAPTEMTPSGPAAQTAPEQELVVLVSPLMLRSPGDDSRTGTPNPFNPQDVEMYLRSRNVPLPRADSLFLIGPQGYAGGARTGQR